MDEVANKLRSEFIAALQQRRIGLVPLSFEAAHPVRGPLFQDPWPPTRSEAMEACPKIKIDKNLLKEENIYLQTELGAQGKVPVLIISTKNEENVKKPAVVFLHSTHKNKEWVRPLLEGYASRGYVAVSIDSRYHGERASSKTCYREALISAWKTGETMPFIFDTVWDLIKLADYLTNERDDVDPKKVGITGESLGGMHAWFAAFADTRYAVAVPIIGVQGFQWAVQNDMWHGRVDSIRHVFEEARIDLGKAEIDKEVVDKVWVKIAPGLSGRFDAAFTVPAIVPRPLLIVNGQDDPRCPLQGLKEVNEIATSAYLKAGCLNNFKMIAEEGIGHQMTPLMVIEASNWFDKHLFGKLSNM